MPPQTLQVLGTKSG